MRSKLSLVLADAHTIMAACRDEATRQNWPVSIAIVDDGGYVIVLERLDGAGLMTPEVATEKARTAALFRAPTKMLEERLADRPAFLKMPGALPLRGGMPIKIDGECVGAVGVSGVQSHEDEQIAIAGIAALG